jgi:hypothetical protein
MVGYSSTPHVAILAMKNGRNLNRRKRRMAIQIQVEKVTEHEDGSATVVFDCNEQARQTLINEGLISLLEKAVSQQNPEYDWTTHKKENENE